MLWGAFPFVQMRSLVLHPSAWSWKAEAGWEGLCLQDGLGCPACGLRPQMTVGRAARQEIISFNVRRVV